MICWTKSRPKPGKHARGSDLSVKTAVLRGADGFRALADGFRALTDGFRALTNATCARSFGFGARTSGVRVRKLSGRARTSGESDGNKAKTSRNISDIAARFGFIAAGFHSITMVFGSKSTAGNCGFIASSVATTFSQMAMSRAHLWSAGTMSHGAQSVEHWESAVS